MMHPQTGEIRQFDSLESAEREGYTLSLKREPKPKCKRCFGRGYVGVNDQGEKVVCRYTQ